MVARLLSLFVHNLDVLYVHTPAKEWINRVRFPILLVVSGTEKNDISLSAFARENLASRDGFDRVPSRVSLLNPILRVLYTSYTLHRFFLSWYVVSPVTCPRVT